MRLAPKTQLSVHMQPTSSLGRGGGAKKGTLPFLMTQDNQQMEKGELVLQLASSMAGGEGVKAKPSGKTAVGFAKGEVGLEGKSEMRQPEGYEKEGPSIRMGETSDGLDLAGAGDWTRKGSMFLLLGCDSCPVFGNEGRRRKFVFSGTESTGVRGGSNEPPNVPRQLGVVPFGARNVREGSHLETRRKPGLCNNHDPESMFLAARRKIVSLRGGGGGGGDPFESSLPAGALEARSGRTGRRRSS